MSARWIVFSAAILVVGAASLVAAGATGLQVVQSHILLGTVADQSGRPLPGATVELSLPVATGSVRTVTTGNDGAYRFEHVVPGVYVLTATLSGFGSAIRDLEIGGGADEFRLDVQLQPSNRGNPSADAAPAGPARRVVCGLTMITPPNVDPRIVVPGARAPQAMPFSDRTNPAPSTKPQLPQTIVKPTMRIGQPTMCWDPTPTSGR
jgi:hypothetical protein